MGKPMLIANQLSLWSRTLLSKLFADSGTDGSHIVRGRAEPDLLCRLGNLCLAVASIAPKGAAVEGSQKGRQRDIAPLGVKPSASNARSDCPPSRRFSTGAKRMSNGADSEHPRGWRAYPNRRLLKLPAHHDCAPWAGRASTGSLVRKKALARLGAHLVARPTFGLVLAT